MPERRPLCQPVIQLKGSLLPCLCLSAHVSWGMANEKLETSRLLTNFMCSCSPLESYLQRQGPLTDVQIVSLSLTVKGLQTDIDNWKRKHAKI